MIKKKITTIFKGSYEITRWIEERIIDTPKKFVFRHLNILEKYPHYTDLNHKFGRDPHDPVRHDRKVRYNHARLAYLLNK